MKRVCWIDGAFASAALLCAAHAQAHFVLLKPTSWLDEDEMGSPQKGSPCGPGNSRPFIGDDVKPIPVSGAATTFHAGEAVTVAWQETVYHPGYFRISLAKVQAADATSTDFPDPALTDTENCHYDTAAVQTEPHGNVLADGLFMAEPQTGTNRSLMQDVKLPDEPCDHCTLQVVQVMEGHPASSCFYFHCADITILPAEAGSDAGSADSGTAIAKPATSHKSSGCSVAFAGTRSGAAGAWSVLASAALFRRRRSHR
jgi:hypothetical protein